MKVALDTNAYSNLAKGKGSPDKILAVRKATTHYLPLFVIAELRVGFEKGSKTKDNIDRLEEFLKKPNTIVLSPDIQTTEHYSQLHVHLSRKGTPIPTNDLWIAALVLQHGLTLCTNDKHFDNIPGIEIFTL